MINIEMTVQTIPLHDERGHAMLEAALLLPWVLFLFVGAFDLGFYNYALISTQNAARVAAWYTSQTHLRRQTPPPPAPTRSRNSRQCPT
jgi:Flp pilus assembly protein TadG